MGANPITYIEVEAFCRLCLFDLSTWEVDLIMRLDDAALSAASTKAPAKTSTGEQAPPTEASATDGASVRAIFRNLAARKKQPQP